MLTSSIPQFPEFKILEVTDKEACEHITKKFLPYSDYNFLSLWSYNTETDTQISVLHGNLVIKFRDYITNDPFYTFLGDTNIKDTIATLLSSTNTSNVVPELRLIPEEVIDRCFDLQNIYTIQEARDQFDYVLSLSDLSSLKGSVYANYRKLINRIHSRFPNLTIRELDIKDQNIQLEVIKFFHKWEQLKDKKRADTKIELTAIHRLLKDSEYFKTVTLGVYSDKSFEGFMITDIEHNFWIQSHFFKANPLYSGLNHYLHHFLAKHFYVKGYQFLNIEQDLGQPNLRIAKEQAKPITYLKKYTISKKTNALL